MEKHSLYDDTVLRATLGRIGRLHSDTSPLWGTMTSAQMLAHCAEIQEVVNGKPLQNTPFLVMLFKGMIRRQVVGDKPYRKGLRTHPQYVIKGERDFETEKHRLIEVLRKAFSDSERSTDVEHPLFGKLTKAEAGWGGYKHIDHHLRQFGV